MSVVLEGAQGVERIVQGAALVGIGIVPQQFALALKDELSREADSGGHAQTIRSVIAAMYAVCQGAVG